MSDNGVVVYDQGVVVSDETVDNYAARLIAILDDNFTPDNAGQALADMYAVQRASQWAVGDILVHARLRLGKNLLGVEASFADALALAREAYGHEDMMFHAVIVLDWVIHCYPSYWILLSSDGTCRVWEVTENFIDEAGFNKWITQMAANHINQLSSSWKTMAAYYRTSLAWPIARRRPDWSYSMHKELGEYAGGSIQDAGGHGLARLPGKIETIADTIEEMETEGPVTAGRIRELYRTASDRKRGYSWLPPMPRFLYVRDNEDIAHLVMEFPDMDADGAYDEQVAVCQLFLLQMTGVVRGGANHRMGVLIPPRLRVDDNLTIITLEDGRTVARIVNQENVVARRAVEDLILSLGI